jgi:hypothetical protein
MDSPVLHQASTWRIGGPLVVRVAHELPLTLSTIGGLLNALRPTLVPALQAVAQLH